MKRYLVILLIIAVSAGLALAQGGVKKKRPLPAEYGRVVMGNYSERAGMAPVVFDHWLHRSQFTCRLCHVDIGFAMKANATGIKAADNMRGYYCGTCHNGTMTVNGRKVFDSCDKVILEQGKTCERCHSQGKYVKKEYDFYSFAEKMPKERFGNGIDWEKAETNGLIHLKDFIEGVSIKRQDLGKPEDFELTTKIAQMPEIIFSHKKHTVWNGCEVCHPEIFVGVKRGETKYSMVDIYNGKYCGVCHITVAFPLLDCQRCHTKPVS